MLNVLAVLIVCAPATALKADAPEIPLYTGHADDDPYPFLNGEYLLGAPSHSRLDSGWHLNHRFRIWDRPLGVESLLSEGEVYRVFVTAGLVSGANVRWRVFDIALGTFQARVCGQIAGRVPHVRFYFDWFPLEGTRISVGYDCFHATPLIAWHQCFDE
jgi:hypothetical protein